MSDAVTYQTIFLDLLPWKLWLPSSTMVFVDGDNGNSTCPGKDGSLFVQPGQRDAQVQLVISLGLGLTAFATFCVLRPRWKSLYAARRRRLDATVSLPTLPDTLLGWIPALYKITEEQVLASAGLDAFVFLSFFKMAGRLFLIIFFFAAAVLEPIHQIFNSDYANGEDPPKTTNGNDDGLGKWGTGKPYLWAYLVFVYFFTFLTLWAVHRETLRIVKIRQSYLGSQTTITDRTFRISGIPKDLRSEAQIKRLVEQLEIGRVESVTLCRNWREIDQLIAKRQQVLHKLEETWSVYLAQQPVSELRHESSSHSGRRGSGESSSLAGSDAPEADERGPLLASVNGGRNVVERKRPQTRIWYGFLGLQSRTTDALDYLGEKLQSLDERIHAAREKNYAAADLGFVTMDSTAACQMAIQALLDPRPGVLLTKLAPSPSDVVWHNTYASRTTRRLRTWIVTVFVAVLSVIWLVPITSLASLINLCTIQKWAPSLARSLSEHETLKALVQTGLPTAAVSLLNVAVPFLYEYMSYQQGTLGRGDIELSIISKNFFFTFFNIFVVFTVAGTATNLWVALQDSLRDTRYIARVLAREVQHLNNFYLNFIMLQGIGLFPFRLLEFGSVALWPIYRMGAKTPRDFKELVQPPIFSYGYYLPTALLVFILCLVYSVLPGGYLTLALGVIYFFLGYFSYKYQLLYAMDQPQHATGGAWRVIFYRILLGLVVFLLTMSGYLLAREAYLQATFVLPLLFFVVWYNFYFKRRFEPLTHFIALRSIENTDSGRPSGDEVDDDPRQGPTSRFVRRLSTVDEDREKGARFMNPSLFVPLEQPWIYQDPPPLVPDPSAVIEDESLASNSEEDSRRNSEAQQRRQSQSETNDMGYTRTNSSSLSLGDTHIWRDANVPGN